MKAHLKLNDSWQAIQEIVIVAKPSSDREFLYLSGFIQALCGIKMPPIKKIMLEVQQQKWLCALNIPCSMTTACLLSR
jgi:hypothetical protein